MNRAITVALKEAFTRLKKYARLVNRNIPELDNIDEATFRAFFLEAFMRANKRATCQIEWNRYDLLIVQGKARALIEFKFYFPSQHFDIEGKPTRWKGRAGSKNEGEFRACVQKLKDCQVEGITHRYLVLAYRLVTHDNDSVPSFAKSYTTLDSYDVLPDKVATVSESSDYVCKLIDLG